jgi:hypothetical protein
MAHQKVHFSRNTSAWRALREREASHHVNLFAKRGHTTRPFIFTRRISAAGKLIIPFILYIYTGWIFPVSPGGFTFAVLLDFSVAPLNLIRGQKVSAAVKEKNACFFAFFLLVMLEWRGY